MSSDLAALTRRMAACRLCRDAPRGPRLPHEPRPVFRLSPTARLLIASQAPGLRAHRSGIPFTDASGDRLRQWMGVSSETFYDVSRIAIAPMGFCFPGYSPAMADLPPRPECRAAWHDQLFAAMPQIACMLAIGRHAQTYHFARLGRPLPKAEPLEAIVRRWRDFAGASPVVIALPHPSWRNSGWLKRNPWFETEVLPALRQAVAEAIGTHR